MASPKTSIHKAQSYNYIKSDLKHKAEGVGENKRNMPETESNGSCWVERI